GDEAMLKQLLRVLADNAVKFSAPGTAITLRAFSGEKGLPAMSVQDNGPGIAAADLPHICERVYRSDPARVQGGTGLGLSIAKWIADRHDGFIDVYSSPGLGSRFTVSLPAAEPPRPMEAKPEGAADAAPAAQ
ncbi:MAG TPA: sensor histidine kinase, partial [Candidatus Limnocylindria bacterium]|nr:sensor histidine kinase [Candidatus Limnocylindria bacterium]